MSDFIYLLERDDGETVLPVRVTYGVTRGRPGNRYGPVEQCYEAEGDEVEVVSFEPEVKPFTDDEIQRIYRAADSDWESRG